MTSLGWWRSAALAVLRHPSLWGVAIGQALRLASPGWWRRPPFLPLPDPAYLRFRLETQYGSDRDPEPGDVVTYLRWCRSIRALT
jgi:hypothetical protein